jgi:hypothetical protein
MELRLLQCSDSWWPQRPASQADCRTRKRELAGTRGAVLVQFQGHLSTGRFYGDEGRAGNLRSYNRLFNGEIYYSTKELQVLAERWRPGRGLQTAWGTDRSVRSGTCGSVRRSGRSRQFFCRYQDLRRRLPCARKDSDARVRRTFWTGLFAAMKRGGVCYSGVVREVLSCILPAILCMRMDGVNIAKHLHGIHTAGATCIPIPSMKTRRIDESESFL